MPKGLWDRLIQSSIKNKSLQYSAYAAVIAAIGALGALLWSKEEESVHRRIRYAVTIENPTGGVIRQSDVTILAPVQTTATQTLDRLDVSSHFYLENDQQGNQRAVVQVADLPPYAAKVVTVTADLRFAEPTQTSPAPDAKMWADERLIESKAPPVAELARQLTRSTPSATTQAIYDWVKSNIRYGAYAPDAKGALAVLAKKEGDCTEFAYLVVALARAAGIAARPVTGFVVDHDQVISARDYHSWAEVYIDGLWRAVDPQKSRIFPDLGHYITLHVVYDPQRQSGEALVVNEGLLRVSVN